MTDILTPEQQTQKDLKDKQIRVTKEIEAILDKENLMLRMTQNIVVLPKE